MKKRVSVLERKFWDIYYVFSFGGTVEQLGRTIETSLRDEEERKIFLELFRKELESRGESPKKIEEKLEEVVKWTEEVWEKPKILGEDFSYNLLIAPFSLFSRYLLSQVVSGDEKARLLDEFFRFSDDIEYGEKRLSRWLRRDTTLAQRVFASPTLILKTRTETKNLFALFVLKLFESDLVKGIGKKKIITYLKNALNGGEKGGILKEEEIKVFDEIFNKWREWLKKNVPIRKNTVGDYVVMRKSRTMLSSNVMSARWVTDKIARELKLEKGQSDESFFPELHRVVIEKIPDIEKETLLTLVGRKKIPKERAEKLLEEKTDKKETAGA